MAENLFTKPTAATPATQAPAAPVVEAEETAPAPVMDELTVLKNRAKLMGISFSNNIGLEALKAKVNAATQGEPQGSDEDDDADDTEETTPVVTKAPEKKLSLRQQLINEQMRLVRVRVTCLDPKKKDLPGEIFTTGNKYIGTVRKFVPFGEQTDNGYHIPFIIYTMMKEREFVSIKTRKTARGQVVEHSMAREFALEVLPPLTEAEIADMKAAQMARGDQV